MSVVLQDGLEAREVTAELFEVPLPVAIEHVAKRVGAQVRVSGGVYFIGQLASSDRGVMVRRVRRLDEAQLNEALQTILSETGRSATFDDGLCIVSDVAGVLDRVTQLLDSVESAGTPGWVVQLEVISFSEVAAERMEVDIVPSGQLAAVVAQTVGDWSDGIEISARLDAVLEAARSRSDVHLVADPVLFLGDGREAQFERVESFPYEQAKTRFTNGAIVRDTTVEFLPVGFSTTVRLRETAPAAAVLELEVTNSNIKAVNEGLPPTTTRDRFTSAVPIRAGGLYLVGAFEVDETKRDTSLGFRRLNAWSTEKRVYQVWLRAYQVEGGATARMRRSQGEERGPDATAITPGWAEIDENEIAPDSLTGVSFPPPAPKADENEMSVLSPVEPTPAK